MITLINRAQYVLAKLKSLYEDLLFPTVMNLRPMTQAESGLYKAINFPNSDQPCIGTFLNVTWVTILDYYGIKIQAIDDATTAYMIPYRASSCQELASQYTTTLDTLVSLTTPEQLFDADFLKKRGFIPVNNQGTRGETRDELQQQSDQQ